MLVRVRAFVQEVCPLVILSIGEGGQKPAEELRGRLDAASHRARSAAPVTVVGGCGWAGECPPARRRVSAAPTAARGRSVPYTAPFPGMLAGGLLGTTLRTHRAGPAVFPVGVRLARRIGARPAIGAKSPIAALENSFQNDRELAVADQRPGQLEQAEVEVGAALIAGAESFEGVQPGQTALDHPALLAQPGAVGNAAAGDPRGDAALAEPAAMDVVVVAAVGEQLLRAAARPAASQIRWCLEPGRPRSTGDGPTWSLL